MAFANFFDKAALNASQILKDYDRKTFEITLNHHNVAIVFGQNATATQEGRAALDLTVRLSARLYPNMSLINTNGDKKIEKQLEEVCLSINPNINLNKETKPTIYLILGLVNFNTNNSPAFYIGASGWHAKFSAKNNIEFSKSNNIYGAACAVCFGLSNIFRKIFAENLPYGQTDSDFTFSVLNFNLNYNIEDDLDFSDEINIGELFLVGVGAIGNSVIWALKNTPSASGKLHLIDKEKIDLPNLQRYALANQVDVEKLKVDVAENFLLNSKISITKIPMTWQDFLANRKDWNIGNVAVCVDSAEDRMAIQSALPKRIFNSWTQQESIGISRHFDFINSPCLMCLYFPEQKKMNRSEEVSLNLGIPQHENIVREYLATGKPIDINFIKLVSDANKIPIEKLMEYVENSLEIFHSKTVCGGVLLKLCNEGNNNNQKNIEVPLAFESAFAGILLAAEIIINTNQLRAKEISTISNINLLRPINKYINEKQSKHHFGRCICCDDNFRKVYQEKWQ